MITNLKKFETVARLEAKIMYDYQLMCSMSRQIRMLRDQYDKVEKRYRKNMSKIEKRKIPLFKKVTLKDKENVR